MGLKTSSGVRLALSGDGIFHELSGDTGTAGGGFSLPQTCGADPVRRPYSGFTDTQLGAVSFRLVINTWYWDQPAKEIQDIAEEVSKANNMAFYLEHIGYGAYFGRIVNRGFPSPAPEQPIAMVSFDAPNAGKLYEGKLERLNIPAGAAGNTPFATSPAIKPSGYVQAAKNRIGLFVVSSDPANANIDATVRGAGASTDSEKFKLTPGFNMIETLPSGFNGITTEGATTGAGGTDLVIVYGDELGAD